MNKYLIRCKTFLCTNLTAIWEMQKPETWTNKSLTGQCTWLMDIHVHVYVKNEFNKSGVHRFYCSE
jgi:hypothetical protein